MQPEAEVIIDRIKEGLSLLNNEHGVNSVIAIHGSCLTKNIVGAIGGEIEVRGLCDYLKVYIDSKKGE